MTGEGSLTRSGSLTNNFMDDIVCARAWHDDDHDGPDGWRQEFLWAYDDGTYSTCDECGDHESFESEEGETLDEAVGKYCRDAEKSWIEYAKDCAETGQDPLGNYSVQHTFTKKENWVIWFTDWVGREEHGYAVIDGRHGTNKPGHKGIFQPNEFSEDVAQYLCLKKVGDRYCMEGVTMKDIRDNVGYVSAGGPKHYMKLKITYDKPRNARDVAREVKAAAQRQVQREVEAGA